MKILDLYQNLETLALPIKTYTIKVVNEHGVYTQTLLIEATNYMFILAYLSEKFPYSKFTILNIENCQKCSV